MHHLVCPSHLLSPPITTPPSAPPARIHTAQVALRPLILRYRKDIPPSAAATPPKSGPAAADSQQPPGRRQSLSFTARKLRGSKRTVKIDPNGPIEHEEDGGPKGGGSYVMGFARASERRGSACYSDSDGNGDGETTNDEERVCGERAGGEKRAEARRPSGGESVPSTPSESQAGSPPRRESVLQYRERMERQRAARNSTEPSKLVSGEGAAHATHAAGASAPPPTKARFSKETASVLDDAAVPSPKQARIHAIEEARVLALARATSGLTASGRLKPPAARQPPERCPPARKPSVDAEDSPSREPPTRMPPGGGLAARAAQRAVEAGIAKPAPYPPGLGPPERSKSGGIAAQAAAAAEARAKLAARKAQPIRRGASSLGGSSSPLRSGLANAKADMLANPASWD